MATLDDKILGEKLQNYCSSSSSEDEEINEDDEKSTRKVRGPKFIPESKIKEAEIDRNRNERGAHNVNSGLCHLNRFFQII